MLTLPRAYDIFVVHRVAYNIPTAAFKYFVSKVKGKANISDSTAIAVTTSIPTVLDASDWHLWFSYYANSAIAWDSAGTGLPRARVYSATSKSPHYILAISQTEALRGSRLITCPKLVELGRVCLYKVPPKVIPPL